MRYTVFSGTNNKALRRRFPIDDAMDIFLSILTSLQREQQEISQSNTAPVSPTSRIEKLGASHNASNTLVEALPRLQWVGIGRSVWKIVKLNNLFMATPVEAREAKLEKEGIVEVKLPMDTTGDSAGTTVCGWGLKRLHASDAYERGVRVFNLGRDPECNGHR